MHRSVLIECNRCSVISKCKYHEDKIMSMKTCSLFSPLESFKVSMLEHLLDDRKIQPVYKLLDKFDLRIEQHHHKPYFKLIAMETRSE